MAIIIEEEKRRFNWFTLAVVVFLVVLIGTAAYYLFFSSTPLIERVPLPQVKNIEQLSSIKLEPEAITNNPNFQILKKYTNPIEIETALTGKTNPFTK